MSARPQAPLPARFTVDAGVAIKLFLVEPYSEKAHALFARLADDPPAELYVPGFFYVECANILWKHVRRLGFPEEQARKALSDLSRLSLRRFPTLELAPAALDLALRHSLSAYDACYVALSIQVSAPLVSADERLVNRLAQDGVHIEWLGSLPL